MMRIRNANNKIENYDCKKKQKNTVIITKAIKKFLIVARVTFKRMSIFI